MNIYERGLLIVGKPERKFTQFFSRTLKDTNVYHHNIKLRFEKDRVGTLKVTETSKIDATHQQNFIVLQTQISI